MSAAALVTFVLLGAGDRALTLDEVCAILSPVVDDAERRGLGPLSSALREPAAVRSVLERLVAEGLVARSDDGAEPAYARTAGDRVTAGSSEIAQLFVVRAIVELSLLALPGPATERDSFDEVFQEALRLRELLAPEFAFGDMREFREQLIAEFELLDPRWADQIETPRDAAALVLRAGFLVADRVVRPVMKGRRETLPGNDLDLRLARIVALDAEMREEALVSRAER